MTIDFTRLARRVLLPLLALTAGCGALGVPLHSFFGDPPIQAQFEPPKVPTLVLVENPRSPGDVQVDADQIAQQVCEELKTKAKLEIIDPDKVAKLREEDPRKYHAMFVADIGKAVGAKQVIYVDLLESTVTGDLTQTTIQAQAVAHVRVVDVTTGLAIWPASPPDGKELSSKMDFDSLDSTKAMAMHMDMLTQLSSRVSKLFYTWKADDQTQEDAGG
jgi:hypothetical protein